MTMESRLPESTNGAAASLGLSSYLLDILVCPVDHGKLEARHGALMCTVCQRTFSVENGIPNMVVDTGAEGER